MKPRVRRQKACVRVVRRLVPLLRLVTRLLLVRLVVLLLATQVRNKPVHQLNVLDRQLLPVVILLVVLFMKLLVPLTKVTAEAFLQKSAGGVARPEPIRLFVGDHIC